MTLPVLHVAAAVLINEKEEFLIAKRPSTKSFSGFWEFVGGKVEKGESFLEALVREVREELLIQTSERSYEFLLTVTHSYEEQGFHLVMPTYLCFDWEGPISPQEHPEVAWITLDQVDGFHHLPTSIPIFKSLEKRLPLCALPPGGAF